MIYATLLMILEAFSLVFAAPAAAEPVYACDPALARLFTPASPILGQYDVCTSPMALDDELVRARAEGVTFGAVELVDALDAFGGAGSVDGSRLARLYRGARPRVARGSRADGDRFESVTLISPYPDAGLSRLLDGTLRIRFHLQTREK